MANAPRVMERAPTSTPQHMAWPQGPAGGLQVLVVEDDDAVRAVCAGVAESLGCRVRTARSVPEARSRVLEHSPDLILLDLKLPGGTGLALLQEVHQSNPRTSVVAMTAYATVSAVAEVMRSGASEFLQKPFSLDQITAILERSATRKQGSEDSRVLEDRLRSGIAPGRLVGQSVAMRKLLALVSKVALTRHPLLITGERGTGKEVVARAIHANGPHAIHPFVAIDCDALEPARLEAELFGFGPAAGSNGETRPGLLLTTGEGTLFLGEIGAVDLAVQSRLARVLEARSLKISPSATPLPVRARVIASTSRNLERLTEQGLFRRDLFYKLSVVHIRVPPLRERNEDVPLLAEHFLEQHRRQRSLPFVFSEHAFSSVLSYEWPGNVAELEALIEHACVLSSEPVLHFEDLTTEARSFSEARGLSAEPALEASGKLQTLEELERSAITAALRQLKGDKVLAAKLLGIGKTTLYRKLKEYGLASDTE